LAITHILSLFTGLSLVVGMAGLVVCISGYKKSSRVIFAYAAVFFGSRALPALVFALIDIPGLAAGFNAPPFSFSYQAKVLLIADYVSAACYYVSLAALVLMIRAFYYEAKA